MFIDMTLKDIHTSINISHTTKYTINNNNDLNEYSQNILVILYHIIMSLTITLL